MALQERFTNLYFERVSLSYNEKLTYWDKVQQDIAAHRHQGANDGWSSLFGSARTLGYIGTIVGAFSNAARFYWHTNTQNIQHLNTVKFEQEIVIDQNKQINVELGTADMCLAWNPGLKRYLACTAPESATSQPVEDAYSEARDSYLCDENDTTPECAEHRNQDAPVDDQGNIESEDPPPPPRRSRSRTKSDPQSSRVECCSAASPQGLAKCFVLDSISLEKNMRLHWVMVAMIAFPAAALAAELPEYVGKLRRTTTSENVYRLHVSHAGAEVTDSLSPS
ncbi:hypothetical protein ACN28S_28690 [Cystobacter fuscus]